MTGRSPPGVRKQRLDFLPFLAGADIPDFARRLLAEIDRKRRRGEVSDRYLRGWVAALPSPRIPSLLSVDRRRHGKGLPIPKLRRA